MTLTVQVFADPTSPSGGPVQSLIAAEDHAKLFSNVDDLVASSSVMPCASFLIIQFFLMQLKETSLYQGIQTVDLPEDVDPGYIGGACKGKQFFDRHRNFPEEPQRLQIAGGFLLQPGPDPGNSIY